MCQHRVIHKCTWYQKTLGKRWMINFVVALSDLWQYVTVIKMKTGANLSTDHHLVVSWIKCKRHCRPGKPKYVVVLKWECLSETPAHNFYLRKYDNNFTCLGLKKIKTKNIQVSGWCLGLLFVF